MLRIYYKTIEDKINMLKNILDMIYQKFPDSGVSISKELITVYSIGHTSYVTVTFEEMSTEKGVALCQDIRELYPDTTDYYKSF